MFVTSFTTAAAFLATGFSEIMPISAFGYFAALLILSNYLLAITMFPAMVILWHKCVGERCNYDSMFRRCCCSCCKGLWAK